MILRFLPVFLMVLLSACMDFPEVWEGPPVETPTEIEEEAEEESSEGEGFDEEEGSVTESGSEPAPIPVRQPDPPVNSEETATTEPEETPTVTGTVVINELYYDAPGSDTDGVLFVELYGTPQLALSGYQVLFINGDNGGVTDVLALPDGSQIAADGFFVIADGRTGALDTTQVSAYDWIDNFDPQNGPDGILLLDPVGSVADSLVYGEGAVTIAESGLPLGEGAFAPKVSSGQSLSRDPAGQDTDDNATDFIINAAPSPASATVLVETSP